MMGEKELYSDKGGEGELTEKSLQKLKELLVEELELVWRAMYTLPEDQSPWIYHRWLIDVANIFIIYFFYYIYIYLFCVSQKINNRIDNL